MDPWKREHARLLFRQQQQMNALRRELATELSAIVARCEQDTFTVECYHRARREMQPVLARYYGRYPGDTTARFYQHTVAMGRLATERAVKLSRDLLSRHLSRFAPDVLAYLKERGKE
jgi:hypothetical protein